MTTIKLTESTDARNGRMWDRLKGETSPFHAHCVLIEWQDLGYQGKGKMTAWSEGPKGLRDRIKRGVPGYEELIQQWSQKLAP